MEPRLLHCTEVPFPSTGRVYATRFEGGCPYEFPLDEIVPEVEDAIRRGLQTVILKALPNSGKTKRLPVQLVQRGHTVLLLAPQVGDLPDVHERLSRHVSCKVSAGQLMRLESRRNELPQVQVVSVGLAAMWLHAPGDWHAWWNQFDVVLCDEAHVTQTNFIYGYVLSLLLDIMPTKTFVLMSGTSPDTMGRLQSQCTIICEDRRYALDHYLVQTLDKYAEALKLVLFFFLDSRRPVLVFLAGKGEIADMKKRLQQAGLAVDLLESIHADIGIAEMQRRTQGGHTKVYLSTSVGETSLTIPGVVVINMNEQRHISYDCGLLQICDSLPSHASQIQRVTRSGRTEGGLAVTFGQPGDTKAAEMDDESVLRVICWAGADRAIENKFYTLQVDNVKSQMHRIATLFEHSSQHEVKEAASFPFSLELAAIYVVGRKTGVAKALAALLIAIDSSACKGQSDVMEVIRMVQGGDRPSEKVNAVDEASVAKARKTYKHFTQDRRIASDAVIDEAIVLEKLACAFLAVRPMALCVRHEETVWYAGRAVQHPGPEKAIVGIHFQKVRNELKCLLELPVPEKVRPHQVSVSLSSDSTMCKFLSTFEFVASREGHQVQDMRITSGGKEDRVAQEAMTFSKANVLVLVQNGNGFMHFRECSEKATKYLEHAALTTAATLKLACEHGVVFVGCPDLSPGVRFVETYSILIKEYVRTLRTYGIAVVTDADVTVAEDGIHWEFPVSVPGVQKLIRRLLREAKSVDKIRNAAPVPWCFLRGVDGFHYPTCIGCQRRITEKHLESRQHKKKYSCVPDAAFGTTGFRVLRTTANTVEHRPCVFPQLCSSSSSGFHLPEFPDLSSLPIVFLMEGSTSLLLKYQVTTNKRLHAKKWWVGINVSRLRIGSREIDVVAHVTVGYVDSDVNAARLVDTLSDVDMRRFPFKVLFNRDCWPHEVTGAFLLDILAPADPVLGFRDALFGQWTLVMGTDSFKQNIHMSLKASLPIPPSTQASLSTSAPLKLPPTSGACSSTEPYRPSEKSVQVTDSFTQKKLVAVGWHGSLHYGTIASIDYKTTTFRIDWRGEATYSTIPFVDFFEMCD